MRPTKQTLSAALSQLNGKWKDKAGVTRVGFQTDSAGIVPMFVFYGPTTQAPPGLPGSVVVPDVNGRPYKVSIFWRQNEDATAPAQIQSQKPELFNNKSNAPLPLDPLADADIDKAYFWFFTPADENFTVKNWLPAFNVPQVPTNMAPPLAELIDTQIHVDMRLPQYDNPNFWAKAFEPSACICCTYYMRPTIVYSYTVPDTYLLVLDGISYDVNVILPFGTIFQVEILRGGAVAAIIEEIVVDPANPDPSNRVAFCNHSAPTPLHVTIDRGENLTVKITVKGPYPFTKTQQDTFCGDICVLLHGWLGSLTDNRDGAPRPVDVGEMREGVGNETLKETTEEYVKTLLAWVGAVTGTK